MVKVEPLGHSSFKISGQGAGLVVDPFHREATGLEWKKRTADLVLVTKDEPAYNNVEGVSGFPYIISGPGEYEVKGIYVCGISSDGNTFYQFKVGGIFFLHLGSLNCSLNDEQLSGIGEIDILFVPVGGVSTLDPEKAAEVVARVEPRVVIPMHYQRDTEPLSGFAPVEKFTEEMGERVERLSEFKLKSQADLPEETEVVILEQ